MVIKKDPARVLRPIRQNGLPTTASDKELAAAAQKAAALLKEHYANKEQFVLAPPSSQRRSLEPHGARHCNGRSLGIAKFENDHVKITSLINELIEAGKKKRDGQLVRLATLVAAQSLNDSSQSAHDESLSVIIFVWGLSPAN